MTSLTLARARAATTRITSSTATACRSEMEKRRPVFFKLLQIQLPVGALTSITHRITGLLLALGIPISVYLLDGSLRGPQSYAQTTSLLDHWAMRGAAILFAWALA